MFDKNSIVLQNKNAIYNVALNLRNKIEQCQRQGYFTSFPNGYCALSSIWMYDILKEYLRLDNIKILQKDPFFRDYPHTWVHCNEFDIDITADQFGDNFPKVYVGYDNLMYRHPDNITSKKILFPTEFVLKQMIDPMLEDGVEMLYRNINIDIESFYK